MKTRFLLPLAVVASFVPLASLNAQEWAASIGWESKYVSEGRDNLGDGGLVSFEGIAVVGSGIEFGAFYGEGSSVDYGEWHFWVADSFRLGDFDVVASYAYLTFTEDNSDDHEFALEFAAPALGNFNPAFAVVYSVESDGLFFEASIDAEYPWRDGFTIAPYALLALNSGYVADEPKGLNHFQLGAALSWQLNEAVGCEFFANTSLGIADGVGDITWFGFRMSR